MVETKPSCPPEGNDLNNSTDKNKGQAPKSKNYRVKKTLTKYQVPDPEAKTNSKGWFSDLEGCIFDLGLKASDKLSINMKYLQRYLGATYRDSCQSDIMIKTLDTFPDPEMSTIAPNMVVQHPNTDVDITYLKNKSIDEYIHQKLRNKDVYETDMHNIYNLIVGQKNKQLKEKAAYYTTFHVVKIG